MQHCDKCSRENPDRNYYCYWCGCLLKEKMIVRNRYDKCNYILKIEVVNDDTLDKDFFQPYKNKQKGSQ